MNPVQESWVLGMLELGQNGKEMVVSLSKEAVMEKPMEQHWATSITV